MKRGTARACDVISEPVLAELPQSWTSQKRARRRQSPIVIEVAYVVVGWVDRIGAMPTAECRQTCLSNHSHSASRRGASTRAIPCRRRCCYGCRRRASGYCGHEWHFAAGRPTLGGKSGAFSLLLSPITVANVDHPVPYLLAKHGPNRSSLLGLDKSRRQMGREKEENCNK